MAEQKSFWEQLPPWPEGDFSVFGEVEETTLSRIQTLTASFMSRNWLSIPHVTHHDDVDTTALEQYRQGRAVKVSPLVFMVKALVDTLKAFPRFNASLDGSGKKLILKKYFHIGIAIDTPNGLLVGVVRDCDQKDLGQLAEDIAQLSARAREKGLSMAEMSGGCMTISSLGGIGGTAFTPIINAPEVAILGITRSEWKPARGEAGELVWHHRTPFSLSYDHRVINGADAARFVRHLDAVLSDPAKLDANP